ncbi:hypothetical protein STRIP9103_09401 [Streptomyces ipomoeae 91-03]|uniref:Uncharacterized protein n=1 Tax=Streptomyces ipomoeae 91-03 TaxID=698759 RepID=L1L769_9ACTN|nr:hypothetical protein STRIP9103_09401 [Streptomyces ipomoeae 91-03]
MGGLMPTCDPLGCGGSDLGAWADRRRVVASDIGPHIITSDISTSTTPPTVVGGCVGRTDDRVRRRTAVGRGRLHFGLGTLDRIGLSAEATARPAAAPSRRSMS